MSHNLALKALTHKRAFMIVLTTVLLLALLPGNSYADSRVNVAVGVSGAVVVGGILIFWGFSVSESAKDEKVPRDGLRLVTSNWSKRENTTLDYGLGEGVTPGALIEQEYGLELIRVRF